MPLHLLSTQKLGESILLSPTHIFSDTFHLHIYIVLPMEFLILL